MLKVLATLPLRAFTFYFLTNIIFRAHTHAHTYTHMYTLTRTCTHMLFLIEQFLTLAKGVVVKGAIG